MKRRLLLLGARETCVSLIPMGIDPERFKYSMRDVTDDEPLRIVSVGRLDEVKGHTYLIQAIRQLVDQGGDVKLRIVGDGPLGAALKAEIAAANLNERVVMVGAIPSEQVIDELHHAHLFALTGVETKSGKAEAQGVVFAEAQATGLPVIACDVGGTADGMVNGESGVLCATRDVASVVAALEDFSADRAKITRFGRAGRRFVEQHYSIHAMLDRFERLYDEQL